MGSTEEPDSSSHASESSPTAPLLPKPYLQSPTGLPSGQLPEWDRLRSLDISYNHESRSFKDISFLIIFLLFVLSTFALGIFASARRNPNYSDVSAYAYDTYSADCIKRSNPRARSSSNHLIKDSIWTIVITLFLSIPFALCILFLLKRYTKQLVYTSLPFFIALPVFFNLYWFISCTSILPCSDSIPLVYRILILILVFLLIGFIIWILVLNWNQVELTVQIIGVASAALSRNLRLFMVLPWLCLGLVVYLAPIIAFLVFARSNGKIIPYQFHKGYKCVWKQDSWVPWYYTLAIVTMLWSVATALEVHSFVISSTVAQWYFSEREHEHDSPPKSSIRESLRNAFAPSFGTLCLSGLLILVVRIVRAVVDGARREIGRGAINMLFRCCVNSFLFSIDFLNKFTIGFAAITGEDYCSSARLTYELLQRNALSPAFVGTVSTRLLAAVVFTISSGYAVTVCAVLNATTELVGVESYAAAAAAAAVMGAMMGYCAHVLDGVVDVVYVCYAMDRWKGRVSNQDVHDVYVRLPICKPRRPYYNP